MHPPTGSGRTVKSINPLFVLSLSNQERPLQHEEIKQAWKGYPNCSNATRDSIIFTGLMGRKVRDTRMSPARLHRV